MCNGFTFQNNINYNETAEHTARMVNDNEHYILMKN
jgi:hypothetical protein